MVVIALNNCLIVSHDSPPLWTLAGRIPKAAGLARYASRSQRALIL